MDKVLQLCDTQGTNYPDHFRIFLDNCIEKYAKKFVPNDYLFAAVYFIVLECGFCPVNFCDEFPQLCVDSFDVRKLQCIKSYPNESMKLSTCERDQYWIYGISLELGKYSLACELQGVPSSENNTYLIINFLLKTLGVVKSLCLSTSDYIEKLNTPSKHSFRLKNLDELSLIVKDRLSNPIKEMIMLNTGKGCCPQLLRLPEDIQKKIIYCLTDDAANVQNLSSTCTYFYNVITTDLKLWEILTMSEFDGKRLNDALNDVMQRKINDDCNIFRMVFLELKMRMLSRPYRLRHIF